MRAAEMEADDSRNVPRIMVFRPTLQEMKNFPAYLEFMESQGAHLGGLAKIIPPPEWIPRKQGYNNINITIKSPIEQFADGSQGIYNFYNMTRRSMSFADFEKMANSPKHRTPSSFDFNDLESKYWKTIGYNAPIYGADVPGTLTDKDCEEFNINKLNTILDMINDSYGVKIMGVNTAYLYFGMWKSTFAWHTEDMDLYSINYLHFGSPKSWYTVPPKYGKKFEDLAKSLFPHEYDECPAFLRHKRFLINPKILRSKSIPVNKITQEAGEFMITFPYAYHAGFNHGLNCAESTNFALPRWVEFGKYATQCFCWSDTVKINMDVFVRSFQPDRYEDWLEGKDIAPDPRHPGIVCAAPSPFFLEDFYKPKRAKRQKRHSNGNGKENNIQCSQTETTIVQDTLNTQEVAKQETIPPQEVDPLDAQVCNINANVFSKARDSSSSNLLNVSTILSQLSLFNIQYVSNPQALAHEIVLNRYSSLLESHCAVCSISRPFSVDQDVDVDFISKWSPPPSSTVLLPKAYLNSRLKKPSFFDSLLPQSTLLTCSSCHVCVHSICYGIFSPNYREKGWKCDRCVSQAFDAACCLCPVRGGALKPTQCKRWVHLACCFILPSVKLDIGDDSQLTIDISGAQSVYKNITCTFCNKKSSSLSNYIIGHCVQCNANATCSLSFHPSCGHREGVVFHLTDHSSSFTILCKTCNKHRAMKHCEQDNGNGIEQGNDHQEDNNSQSMVTNNANDIDVGAIVIGKYHSFYSYAQVIDKHPELFHHVQFVDNSKVDTLKSCDILNRDCQTDQPRIGDPVEVIWNKEQLHGIYSGCHTCWVFRVVFDNNVELTLPRTDVFPRDATLPKRVLYKLVDNLTAALSN